MIRISNVSHINKPSFTNYCTGNITTKSIKGDFISLLSQSGDINCLSNSQGRIIIQSGSGVGQSIKQFKPLINLDIVIVSI